MILEDDALKPFTGESARRRVLVLSWGKAVAETVLSYRRITGL